MIVSLQVEMAIPRLRIPIVLYTIANIRDFVLSGWKSPNPMVSMDTTVTENGM
jgi:hypothetical protein